jgi:hypothetical protein
MRTSRLIPFLGLFSVVLLTFIATPVCHGQISSWVDENGVRHFSNVETSDESKKGKNIEEYMTSESDEEVDRTRDRFKILDMYEEEMENKQKQEALEEEMKAAEKKEREQHKAERKAAREKRKECSARMKSLDDLRHKKWQDYDTPELALIACPDKRWRGVRGKVYDNMKECTERRDKARKIAYEQALRQMEDEVNSLCAQ